jgi:hypothetical protein
MKKIYFTFLMIVVFLFSGNLLKAQTSVYVCSTNGTYGYCYGKPDVKTCAYNECIKFGGKTPNSILSVSAKGYGAIAVGKKSDGGQVVGAAAGYEKLTDAILAAIEACKNQGGLNVAIDETFQDE